MLVNFKTALFAAVTLLFAGQAAAEALIATNPGGYPRLLLFLPWKRYSPCFCYPVAACNCPNNCSYTEGHSCKYKAGPSTSSSTVSGRK